MVQNVDTPAAHNGRIILNGHDHAIFAELQRDGRMPFATIGARVGLSEAQVRRRVRWLTEADVFAVTAVAHPSVLGLREHDRAAGGAEHGRGVVADPGIAAGGNDVELEERIFGRQLLAHRAW